MLNAPWPLPSEIPECVTPPHPPPPPMPSEFHNREPAYPSEFPFFFWKFIFDLATPISTNKHEFMPPQGCDPVAPGDKLYSSATRKTYRVRPGTENSLLSRIFFFFFFAVSGGRETRVLKFASRNKDMFSDFFHVTRNSSR